MKRSLSATAILVGLSCLNIHCDLFPSNSPGPSSTPTVHVTKIVGAIIGDYAAFETVTFSVDGAVIGDATGSGTVSQIVTPGVDHVISGTSKNVPLTLSVTVNLKEGEINTFNFPCKPAHVTVVTDAALALWGVTSIKIYYLSGPGAAVVATLVPGEQTTFDVEPSANAIVFGATDQNGRQLSSLSQKLTWDSKFTWTVS